MKDIPTRLRARTLDKVAICLRGAAEMVLHFEMEFDHRLDDLRLEKALDLVLDAEPVLGCRFVTSSLRVYWERLPPDRRRNFRPAVSREEYDAFLAAPLDSETGPQFKGCLWHDHDRDRLALKISHESADAGGLKEAAAVLGGIYTRLKDEPDFVPEPNLKGSRSIKQVLRRMPLWAIPRIYLNYLITSLLVLLPTRGFGYRIPGGHDGRPTYITRHLSRERISRLSEYRHRRQATLNDIFMAAFFRTLAAVGGWDGASELHATMTIDLRRHYLPGERGEAVCNLSTLEFLILGRRLGIAFADTLALVAKAIGRRKASWYGLNDYIGTMPTIWLLPARWSAWVFNNLFAAAMKRGSWVNILTNMGPISDEHTRFDRPAARAWLLIPPMMPPLQLVGLTGYAGSLTLSGTFFESNASSGAAAESFLDKMIAELPE